MEEMFKELWQAAKVAGPFANLLLLFALYIVDKERRAYRERLDALNEETRERVIKAILDTSSAVRDLTNVFARSPKGSP